MIAKALRKARTMTRQEWQLLMAAGRLALFVEIALRALRFDELLGRLEAASARLERRSPGGGSSRRFSQCLGRWCPALAGPRAGAPGSGVPSAAAALGCQSGHCSTVKSALDCRTSRAACAHAVDRAYRLLPLPRTCLNESLTLFGLLRRQGLDARFCLGVRKEGERLAAHAWIQGEDTPPEIDPQARLKPGTTKRKPDTSGRTDESFLPLSMPIPDRLQRGFQEASTRKAQRKNAEGASDLII
jgi:hypothetical protein